MLMMRPGLEACDENDEDVVLSRFVAYLKKFDQNEFCVDQSDQPNELLRLYARPVKALAQTCQIHC